MPKLIAFRATRRASRALGILIVTIMAAGCGVSAAPSSGTSQEPAVETPAASPTLAATFPPSAAPTDPCALVSQDEADRVGGVRLRSPQPAGLPPVRCVWAAPLTGHVAQLEIDVGDGAKKSYDIDHTVLKHDFSTVANLGDEAYAEPGAIFFRKGEMWVAIHLLRLDGPDTGPDLEQLARLVVARI